MMEKTIREKGTDLLRSFDYQAVHDYMVEHKLTHCNEDEPPTIEELKRTASVQMHYALMRHDQTGEATHCGSGGFNVYIFPGWKGIKLTYEPIPFKKSSY